MVVVFDLGVGQGRALDRAPHHRLGAAVELAGGHELVELGDDGRLGPIVHGGVAVLPVADHAQPLEAVHLHADPMFGVFAAAGAKLGFRHLVLAAALGAQLLLDPPLDRQAVAVPAGQVVDVIAQGEARADDEVLQRLLQGVADVDRAVGVGRSVVQHEHRRARRLTGGAHGVVEVQLGPAGQDLRLLLRQARAHGEGRVGKKDGFAVVAFRRLGVVGHNLFQGSGEVREAGETRRALDQPSGGVTPGV